MKADFYRKYRLTEVQQGLPKYAELREVLRAAIADGFWKQGEKIPPEIELARVTPFSLGTVQKALKALQADGLLQRRQGHGTFVRPSRAKFAHPWHFRFRSSDGNVVLPVYPKVVSKKTITSAAPWARLLDPQQGRLIQIDRKINIGDEFPIYNRFFVSARKYDRFLLRPNQELHSADFKTLLHREYNVAFTTFSYAIQMVKFPDAICHALGLDMGAMGTLVEILASSERKGPVYFQELYIPPNKFKLYITDPSTLAQG